MQLPAGHTFSKQIHARDRHRVDAVVRERDGRELLLKTYLDPDLEQARARAQHELDALRRLAGPGVVTAVELLVDADPPTLVLERPPGVSLEEWILGSAPEPAAVLDAAIALSGALARVHAARLLHRALSPSSVLVDPITRGIHLLDFDLAHPVGAAQSESMVRAGSGLTDLLPYSAPEATGRMNRGVDERSDLYSLGATLYFALVGHAPFDATDPLALIHAHMALVPRAPQDARPALPAAVSRAVMKLLEKEPADRYQSIRALLADLRRFQEQLRERGAIDPDLSLGTAEIPDRPRFSSKLYGRDQEIALLRERYARAVQGSTQLLMIAGAPGTGKSALVDELRPQIAQSHGYLAVGKFDLSNDRPCGAWAAALGSFVQQLLTESEARLAPFRHQLREGLGNIAGAMVDLVPDLQFVLGPVPPTPNLPPRETQARRALALRRFIVSSATAERPLVIFLDDLQWSDAASRELIEDLVAHETKAHLFILGAYRGNEIDAQHPVMRSFESLARRETAVQIISIGTFSRPVTIAMLADVLERSPEDVTPVAELIERKTGNAPLFIRQFVEHLHGQGLLSYVLGAGWTWDPKQVAAGAIPEGAVALMTAKLERLQAGTRAAIELASCVGDQFDLQHLAEVSSLDREQLEKDLYVLCDLGLISPCPEGFRFVHDRIREAARDLLSAEQQERLHYEIAQRILESVPAQDRARRIFELAEHLDGGLAHVPEAQRLDALRINRDAGRAALATGAAATAARFLAVGRQLLREEDWSSDPQLAFDLCMASVESTLACGHFAESPPLLDTLERRAPSRLQAAQVATRRLQFLVLTGDPEHAAHYALEQLRRFGVRLPPTPSERRVRLWLRWLQWRLRGHRAERALQRGRLSDPNRIASLVLIGATAAVLSRASYRLLVLSACWSARSNLKHGALVGAGYCLAGIASFIQEMLGDSRDSERLEQLSLAHQERAPELTDARLHLAVHSSMRPWRMARREAIAPLPRVATALHELGDVEHADYTRFLHLIFGALAGNAVAPTTSQFQELCESVRRSGYRYPEPEICARPYRLLSAAGLSDVALDAEIEASERELAAGPGSAAPFARTFWQLVLCVLGRFEQAAEQGDRLGDRGFHFIRLVHLADLAFYRGLANAAQSPIGRRPHRRQLRIFRSSLVQLRRWARSGPDFQHMANLLEAEQARLTGNARRARALYDRAVLGAGRQNFPHHAALANERLAQMLTEMSRPNEAAFAWNQALALYEQWGASAKCTALREATAGKDA